MRAKLTICLLIACALLPKTAAAQYSLPECTSVLHTMVEVLHERSFKRMIPLERQYLTYCKARMQRDEYIEHLHRLTMYLIIDNQHQEALDVANNCLRINENHLPCLSDKVNALQRLGRMSEANSVAEMALSLGAITDDDVAAKQALQQWRQWHQSHSAVPARGDVVSSLQNQIPSSRADVPLKKEGGTFCDARPLSEVRVSGCAKRD